MPHYDVDAAMQDMQAQEEEAARQARAMPGLTPLTRQFVEAQIALTMAALPLHRTTLETINGGAPQAIVMKAMAALAAKLLTGAMNSAGRHQDDVLEAFMQGMDDEAGGMIRSEVSISPMQGGRA